MFGGFSFESFAGDNLFARIFNVESSPVEVAFLAGNDHFHTRFKKQLAFGFIMDGTCDIIQFAAFDKSDFP